MTRAFLYRTPGLPEAYWFINLLPWSLADAPKEPVARLFGIVYNTIMKRMYRVAIDTNVFVSALRSRRGASFRLLFEADRKKFLQCISVPLILEYEKTAKAASTVTGLSDQSVDDIIDGLCLSSSRRKIFFLWRPQLRDPGDDFILELAVEATCDYIITYNIRDFKGASDFGIKVISPKEFLNLIGELK